MSDEKPCHVSLLEPRYARVIQIVGALGTLAAVVAMYIQLGSIWREQAVTLRPYVNVDQRSTFRNLGREDEIWDLTYIFQNSGKYPATRVFYRAEYAASPTAGIPSVYDNPAAMMISPEGGTLTFTKSLPRSEVLAAQARNERVYRHLYVKYEDPRGKTHYTRATWILLPYVIGQEVGWVQISSEGS